ncbi:MAG: hypothetical protein ACO376_02275 [Gammaproteobacteria bacterium]
MNIPAEICTPENEAALRQSLLVWLQQLSPAQLPQLTFGQIEPGSLEISILSLQRKVSTVEAHLQFWFRETLAGSSCGFEASADAGYAEAMLMIDCASSQASFSKLDGTL